MFILEGRDVVIKLPQDLSPGVGDWGLGEPYLRSENSEFDIDAN